MVQSETSSVSDRARTMARQLVAGADLWLPVSASYQDLTIALLPPLVRERFGLSFADRQKREIDRVVASTRWLYPFSQRGYDISGLISRRNNGCAEGLPRISSPDCAIGFGLDALNCPAPQV
jgi:uncharacterized protein (DUF2236 family)